MNLTIDRLSLQLPSGFEQRADAISRRIGDELAGLAWHGSYTLDQVRISPLQVRPEHSDRQIAAQIARAIHQQITTGKG